MRTSPRVAWSLTGAGISLATFGAFAGWIWSLDAHTEAKIVAALGVATAIVTAAVVALVPDQPAPAAADDATEPGGRSAAWWFGMTRGWWTPQMIVLRLILLCLGLLLVFGSCQVIIIDG